MTPDLKHTAARAPRHSVGGLLGPEFISQPLAIRRCSGYHDDVLFLSQRHSASAFTTRPHILPQTVLMKPDRIGIPFDELVNVQKLRNFGVTTPAGQSRLPMQLVEPGVIEHIHGRAPQSS